MPLVSQAPGDQVGPLRAARRAGLIDQVIAQLRGQITAGTWPIGARIPTESELAALTGTSRNTVREAVQSLVHAGLLERRQGSGTYVLAHSEMAGAVSRQVAGAHRIHVLEVRRALEVGAARLAADRRTDEDVAEHKRLIEARNASAREGSLDGVIAYDILLHRAIVRASHNPVLIELYENFLGALGESVRDTMQLHGQIAQTEHRALIEAIEARDGDASAAEAACYLDEMIEEVLETTPGSE